MATTGQRYPTVAQSSAIDAGDLPWVSAQNACANDGSAACVTASNFDISVFTEGLICYGFDFTDLSAGTTIDGAIVRVEGMINTSCMVISCQLLTSARAMAGTNHPGASNTFSTGYVVFSTGGSADKWGYALNITHVQDSDFGVGIRCKATSNNADVWIDYVTVELIYDSALSGNNETNVKFVEC